MSIFVRIAAIPLGILAYTLYFAVKVVRSLKGSPTTTTTSTQPGAIQPSCHCLFCDIIQKDKEAVLYEDEHCYVIKDIYPDAEAHLLVITKQHIPTSDSLLNPAAEFDPQSKLKLDPAQLLKHMQRVGRDAVVALLTKTKTGTDLGEGSSFGAASASAPPSEPVIHFAFHRSPFCSIRHLHMHCLAGKYKSRLARLSFLEGMWWVHTPAQILNSLLRRREEGVEAAAAAAAAAAADHQKDTKIH